MPQTRRVDLWRVLNGSVIRRTQDLRVDAVSRGRAARGAHEQFRSWHPGGASRIRRNAPPRMMSRPDVPPTRIAPRARSTSLQCSSSNSSALAPLSSNSMTSRLSSSDARISAATSSWRSSRGSFALLWQQQSVRSASSDHRGRTAVEERMRRRRLVAQCAWLRLDEDHRGLWLRPVEELHQPHDQQCQRQRAGDGERRVPPVERAPRLLRRSGRLK